MKKNFTLIYLLLIFIVGTALKGFTQTAGDFQTKGISGNWSDFNAWNIYNGSMWIAATSGQIPIATSSVFVQAAQTITVDNGLAACNDLNVTGATSSKIAFLNATCILNVNGNMNLFSTAHNCFGAWAAGAKIVFSGTGAQGFTNLSVNSVFVNIEVNKSSGTLTTSSNFRFGSFTLTAGNFTVGSTNQIQGTSTAATININGGVWNQVVSTTQIFSIPTASPLPIGALNINGGSIVLATTNGATGFMFSTISITNGGTFTLNNFTGNISISTSINIDATSTFNTALTTTALPPTVTFNGVVNFNFAGAQTISQATYSYLKLNGTGIKTLAAGTTTIPANGTLEMSGIATSPTLALGSGTLTVSNSATNLLYTSTGVQTASLTEWDPNFQNITVNNAAGVSMANLTRTILGSLNLTNGTFNIGANGALTLDGAPLNRTNGYIGGTIMSDLTVTGTTGGTVLLPLSANISLRNVTIGGTRTLSMDGTNNINLSGAFTIANGATYDNGGESQIRNGGTPSISITGKFITRAVQGFYGSNTAIPGILPTLNSGSTVEYGLLGDQTVQGGTIPPYYDVTFSGSGTKTLQSTNIPTGTITVSGSAIFDAQNFTFGGAGTNLTMTGTSRYINGGGTTKPDAQGVYTLGPATTIEFALNSATTIRLGLSPIQYANIVVSGTNVSNASTVTGIAFQIGGSFIVTPGATFKLENAGGFTGSTSAAISITNNPFILIQNGSTIEYSGTGNQLITNQFPYQNLSIAGSGNKTAPSSVLTLLGDLTKSGASTFLHNSGTVLLIGFSAESFAGLTYNNLILSNSTKTTSGNTTIIDSIKINDGTTLSISSTPDTIILHSDAAKTARIGQIGTGTINYNTSGKFVVERYIPARKAWRFLAVAVNSATQTIKDAWQEGALNMSSDPKPGYGTQITSDRATWAADGFDVFSSGGPSVKTYITAGNNYSGILSTSALFDPTTGGYMTFIRGNRLANSFASPVSATVLRTAGTLFTGSQAPINVISGDIIPVNNPYASPLDLRQISQSDNVFYYVWDPNRGGTYGLGAFQTLSWNGSDYDVVPGSGSYGATNNFIAGGQAFFASTLGADTSVQLTEVAKTPALFSVTPFTPVGVPSGKLRTNLYGINTDGSSFLADGFLCSFGNNYSNSVNGMDAAKLSNFGENLSVKNNNVLLAIERRPYPRGSDTIFLNLTGTSQHQYRLETILSGLSKTGSDAYVEDNYLHTRFLINADDTTKIDFAVNGDVTSSAPDRFRIVFEAVQGPLLVTFTNAGAYLKNENIVVNWNVENETGIKYYQVEKSPDGTSFTPAVADIAHNNQPGSSYNWLDVQPVAGYNYYRIKSIGINGEINYSKILQVFAGNRKNGITVYPNPVSDGIIHLQLNNQPEGKYGIQLINKAGQVILSKEIQRAGNGSSTESIPLESNTAHGLYLLEVLKPDGSKAHINVIF